MRAHVRRPVVGTTRLAAIALLVCRAAAAQTSDYDHDWWLPRDGVPGAYVHAILQSPDGYLWFSTLAGLARFDGVRFTLFDPTNTPALRNASAYPIRPLLVDRRGVMWIGTSAGVVQYQAGDFRQLPSTRSAGLRECLGMAEDGMGRLWAYSAGENGHLLVFRGDHFELAAFRLAPTSRITAIASDQRGDVWLGTESGLLRVRNADTLRFTQRDGLPADGITALHVARDGALWIGTSTGLARLENDHISAYGYPPAAAPAGSILSIADAADGSVWVGTDGEGLLHWKDGRLHAFATHGDTLSNLTDNVVASVFVDREGTLWAGTSFGLDQYHHAPFHIIGRAQGMPAEAPGPLHWDSAGALWVAPASGGLLRGLPGSFAFIDANALARVHVLSMASHRGGGLWLGWRGGVLLHRDRVVQSYSARDGLTGGLAQAVLEDRSGRLWVGTATGGVHRVDNGRITSFTASQGLAGDDVRALFEDTDGALWVGTHAGISRIRGDSITSYHAGDGRGPSVTAIDRDTRGRIWFASLGGLARIVSGRVAIVDQRQGLPASVITGLTDDAAGDLWLITSIGLLRVSADDLAAVTEGRRRDVQATTFGTRDGLASSSPLPLAQPPAIRSPDGRIWLSTPAGLVMFDPARVAHNPIVPPVHIEQMIVDGIAMPPESPATLGSQVKRVEVNYTALSLRSPIRVQFRYRLGGFDQGWVDAGTRRTASFTNLGPGTYHFHVIASNDDAVWNDKGATLDFEIVAAFYRRQWFYALVAFAAIAAAWSALRYRQRQMENRLTTVLAERTRMAREIHDTLLQGFTGITLQLEATTRLIIDAPHRAREYLEKILTVADQTLADARNAVWDLRSPALASANLVEAFEELVRQNRSATKVNIKLWLSGASRRLEPATELALFRIGQEALANAVLHAEARNISVELIFGWRVIRVIVRDDGRGFDASGAEASREGHWGIPGMRERAEQVGAHLAITSAPGGGTTVVIDAPAR